MTARNMTPAGWAVVPDHFHGFGIGEADWFLDGFSSVCAPLRTLAPIAIVDRPEAYRAACAAILESRTRQRRTTAMSGGVLRGIGVGLAHVGACVLSFGLLASSAFRHSFSVSFGVRHSPPRKLAHVHITLSALRVSSSFLHVPAMPRWSVQSTPQAEQADAANSRWRVLVFRKGFWFFIVLGRR
jgi:hypothetical protein